jgi:hypothetical protein
MEGNTRTDKKRRRIDKDRLIKEQNKGTVKEGKERRMKEEVKLDRTDKD